MELRHVMMVTLPIQMVAVQFVQLSQDGLATTAILEALAQCVEMELLSILKHVTTSSFTVMVHVMDRNQVGTAMSIPQGKLYATLIAEMDW